MQLDRGDIDLSGVEAVFQPDLGLDSVFAGELFFNAFQVCSKEGIQGTGVQVGCVQAEAAVKTGGGV